MYMAHTRILVSQFKSNSVICTAEIKVSGQWCFPFDRVQGCRPLIESLFLHEDRYRNCAAWALRWQCLAISFLSPFIIFSVIAPRNELAEVLCLGNENRMLIICCNYSGNITQMPIFISYNNFHFDTMTQTIFKSCYTIVEKKTSPATFPP
jgi:hypothetical protein